MSKNRNSIKGVIIILLLAMLACVRTSNPTPMVSPHLPAGESTHILSYDGLNRSYIRYIPASIDWSQPVSVILVFHGGGGNAESAVRMSGFNEVADQNGFIIIYPNGTGPLENDKLLTWNGGSCCGYAQENRSDDVGFVRAIMSDLEALVTIDPNRIYATGMSNGGIMSYRLACEAADLFAAVAPVAGTLNFSPCNPPLPVSVIDFHGTTDQHIPYEGGFGSESLVDVNFTSVEDSIGFWLARNGCDPQPQTNTFADIQHENWPDCEDAIAVELYTIIGGGHAWPGGQAGRASADQPSQTIFASQLIWEFFETHPKP